MNIAIVTQNPRVAAQLNCFYEENTELNGSQYKNKLLQQILNNGFDTIVITNQFLTEQIINIWKSKLTGPFGICYADYIMNGIRVFREPYSKINLFNNPWINEPYMIKTEVLKNIGVFDETLEACEDYDYALRASRNYLFYHVPMVGSVADEHYFLDINKVNNSINQIRARGQC